MTPYQSEAEILSVVRSFESCETGKEEFKHRDHLVVAVWYLQTLGPEQAFDRMRSALLRFLNHHQVDRKVYSDEITAFWVQRIAQRLSEFETGISLLEKCNRIVESAYFEPQIFADQSGSGSAG